MNEHDAVLLNHSTLQCEKILRLTSRFSYEEFLADSMYQDALIRPLEIIGEAAGQFSDIFKNDHPAIPLSTMKGLRNILAHQYFSVDLRSVWNIATHDVPVLYETVQAIRTSANNIPDKKSF